MQEAEVQCRSVDSAAAVGTDCVSRVRPLWLWYSCIPFLSVSGGGGATFTSVVHMCQRTAGIPVLIPAEIGAPAGNQEASVDVVSGESQHVSMEA
ncbi:unnamed protein product, partial [Prorocentrum cordatum]